ncbi:MAG: M28 family peptidase [Bacteroidetes bacterium]|nr:M28 family peptidase [Bacteroidota bacterium]
MKLRLLLSFILVSPLYLIAQNKDVDRIAQTLTDDQILSPLKYLASDQLRGRHIGLPEIDTAAVYIAEQFHSAGAKPLPQDSGYFQPFNHHFTPLEKFHMDPQVASNITYSLRHQRPLKNIIAFIPGTDPILRKQYIILSSHYDHAGVADSAIMEEGKMDSIFNGAGDNAAGTAAVIAAAKYFARYPTKRSILFICFTAEEEGEFGSRYYVQNPAVPLDHTVYNLNIDNAGNNTTHAICLFGLGRTSADSLVEKACTQYGLTVLPEPAGQDLFNRSDNAQLAQKGIPAPCFSLGMTAWDEKVLARYHRLSDEVGNMDLDYIAKFIRAYILSAQYIANTPSQPKWAPGDPYESDWQTLFKKPQ